MVSEGAPKILKALQGVGDYESVQVLWKCCHDHGIRLKVHPWKSEYRGCVRLVKLPPVINNGKGLTMNMVSFLIEDWRSAVCMSSVISMGVSRFFSMASFSFLPIPCRKHISN